MNSMRFEVKLKFQEKLKIFMFRMKKKLDTHPFGFDQIDDDLDVTHPQTGHHTFVVSQDLGHGESSVMRQTRML